MQNFFSELPVKIVVPLVDSSGAPVPDVSQVRFQVFDENSVELMPWTPADYVASQASIELIIPAATNAITEIRGYRKVSVEITSGQGETFTVSEYMLSKSDILVPLENSFQTFGGAMMTAQDVTGVNTFLSASREDRARGLINAFSTLAALAYEVEGVEVSFHILTMPEFDALPPHFRRAIKRAQVIEADESLNQFSILKKRQQGLMSETIGESSMMFRPEKVLNIPVTRRSMDLLRQFLIWDAKVARV